ncbi:MAG: NYN domain-containing protein, partial [Deltaproteobacteria bacterium]|nr:NYN domain-containing protein [Deltaproteobacteria bacterium]
PQVKLVFAPSADDWLVRRVRTAEAPERIAVVTGDRQVQGRVRHAGGRIVSPRAFLARCPDDEPAPATSA